MTVRLSTSQREVRTPAATAHAHLDRGPVRDVDCGQVPDDIGEGLSCKILRASLP
jgi:hypothetical protein